jgi:hypothetical protein
LRQFSGPSTAYSSTPHWLGLLPHWRCLLDADALEGIELERRRGIDLSGIGSRSRRSIRPSLKAMALSLRTPLLSGAGVLQNLVPVLVSLAVILSYIL